MESTNLQFEQLDLRELKSDQAFDFVYCFDVLEHIQENKLVLENISRALQQDGFYFASQAVYSVAYSVAGSPKSTPKWAAIEHLGQHYEMDSLLKDLESIGYKICAARFTDGTSGRLSFELLEAMRYYHFPEALQFSVIPFLKILRWLDTRWKPKEGDGLLVLCQK